MKIKTKKQLNLPQLIEEIVQNDIINTFAELKSEYPAKQGIQIDRGGRLHLVGMDYLSKNNTFTVEVEEEIDEDTKFRHIVFIDDCGLSASWGNSSINDIKYGKDKEYHAYIDGEFKLIWRDGRLIEWVNGLKLKIILIMR